MEDRRPVTPAVYELKIAERDIDRFGHVNNAAYLALFDIDRRRIVSASPEWRRAVGA